jgi:hypothetical protein
MLLTGIDPTPTPASTQPELPPNYARDVRATGLVQVIVSARTQDGEPTG